MRESVVQMKSQNDVYYRIYRIRKHSQFINHMYEHSTYLRAHIGVQHRLLYHAVEFVNIVLKLNADELKDLCCAKCVNHIHTISVAFSHRAWRQALLIPLYKLFTFYNQFNCSVCVRVRVCVTSYERIVEIGISASKLKTIYGIEIEAEWHFLEIDSKMLTKSCLFFHNFDKQFVANRKPMTANEPQ